MPESQQPEGFRQHRYSAPPEAATILLIRHGESAAANPDSPFPLTGGHGDPPLHADGVEQAGRLGERLGTAPIDAIYVTTLRRTHETAAPLASRLGLTPIVEPDLREVHLGDWEGGVLRARVAAGDPLLAEILRQERWDVIPGAEPLEAFHARTVGAISRIAAANRGRIVVAVVHGGVIGQLLHHATGSSRFAFASADNASISEIVVFQEHWHLRRFNDTSHLV